jgi:hypothetical protein
VLGYILGHFGHPEAELGKKSTEKMVKQNLGPKTTTMNRWVMFHRKNPSHKNDTWLMTETSDTQK